MVEKETVRRGYDEISTAYATERAPERREITIVERFLEALPTSACVLDAGCGQGVPVLRRLDESHLGVGVDFSREQLREAGTNAPDVALVHGDLTRLPLGDDEVDAVTALHSLIHVPRDEHRPAIEEFARVLRPGGRILLTDATEHWRGRNPDWLESGVVMEWHIAGADATRDALRDAGFRIGEERTAADELADEDSSWVFISARLDRATGR